MDGNRTGIGGVARQDSKMVDGFWLGDASELSVCVMVQKNVSDMSDCKIDAAILLCRPIFHGG